MKDKIVQIVVVDNVIRGLSESGRLYSLQGDKWVFEISSPVRDDFRTAK